MGYCINAYWWSVAQWLLKCFVTLIILSRIPSDPNHIPAEPVLLPPYSILLYFYIINIHVNTQFGTISYLTLLSIPDVTHLILFIPVHNLSIFSPPPPRRPLFFSICVPFYHTQPVSLIALRYIMYRSEQMSFVLNELPVAPCFDPTPTKGMAKS